MKLRIFYSADTPLHSTFINGVRLAIATVFLSSAMLTAHASDEDEYLKMLSEEISKPEYVSKIKAEISQSEQEESKTGAAAVSKKKTDTMSDFEMTLVRKYPSSFKIYSDFKAHQKNDVYSTYVATKKMSRAKRKIIDIFLNAK